MSAHSAARVYELSVRSFGILVAVTLLLSEAPLALAQTQCAGVSSETLKRLSAQDVRLCLENHNWIENAIVQGKDIMAVLSTSAERPAVRIRNSSIENGLYFADLAPIDVDTVAEPLAGRLRAMGMFEGNVRVVENEIVLQNSRILPGKDYDETDYSPIAISAGRIVFTRDVDLLGSIVDGSAVFNRAAFLSQSRFSGVRFARRTTFDGAWFEKRGGFVGTRFQGTTLFVYSRLAAGADFRRARFDGGPIFDKARICARVDMGEAVFSTGARFVGIRATSEVNLLDSEFPEGADFSTAQFAGPVIVPRSKAGGILTFAQSRVSSLEFGTADYQSRFDAELDFSDARVGRLKLKQIRLGAPVSFARAKLGPVGFSTDVYGRNPEPRMRNSAARPGCPESAETRDAEAPIQKPGAQGAAPDIELTHVDFTDRVSFEDSEFQALASLDNVSFRGVANMERVSFESPTGKTPYLRLSGVDFGSVDLDWASVPKAAAFYSLPGDRPASDLFHRLEDRYRARDRLGEALAAHRARNWARVRESWACLLRRGECNGFESALAATGYPVWGVVSGFSTSLGRLLLVTLLVDLVFAFLYFKHGRLMERTRYETDGPRRLPLHPLEGPSTYAPRGYLEGSWRPARKFISAVAFSTLVLLRIGETGTVVRDTDGRMKMSRLVFAEWLIGIPLLIDLINTLSETQPFLQRLITGTIG